MSSGYSPSGVRGYQENGVFSPQNSQLHNFISDSRNFFSKMTQSQEKGVAKTDEGCSGTGFPHKRRPIAKISNNLI